MEVVFPPNAFNYHITKNSSGLRNPEPLTIRGLSNNKFELQTSTKVELQINGSGHKSRATNKGSNRVSAQFSQQKSEVTNEKSEVTKELEGHMALRNNVSRIKLALWKEVKPLEYFLIDIIIDKTIAWREEESAIKIEEFMERSGQKRPHIYKALKALEDRKIITRRKVDHKLFFGLNDKFFGDLLIQKHKEALEAKRKQFRLLVSQPKSLYENGTGFVPNSYQSCTDLVPVLYENGTKNDTQAPVIIEEKTYLKTLLKDTSINTITKTGEIVVVDHFVSGKGIPWEKAKEELIKGYPKDEKRLDYAYREISRTKSYHTVKGSITSPAGFILKSWGHIRDTYAFIDEVEERKNKVEAEELPPHDPETSKKVKEIFVSAFGEFPKAAENAPRPKPVLASNPYAGRNYNPNTEQLADPEQERQRQLKKMQEFLNQPAVG